MTPEDMLMFGEFGEVSDDSLRVIYEGALAEMAKRGLTTTAKPPANEARPADNKAHLVRRGWPSYDPKLWTRPWIGVVSSWPVGGKCSLEFGEYTGRPRSGDAGEARIMAQTGAIVRWGHKRKGAQHSDSEGWGVVQSDGTIKEIDRNQARELYKGR